MSQPDKKGIVAKVTFGYLKPESTHLYSKLPNIGSLQRAWNAKVVLDGNFTIKQSHNTASYSVTYRASQYQVILVEDFEDASHAREMATDDLSEKVANQSWRIKLKIVDNTPVCSSDRQPAFADGDRPAETFPLASTYPKFEHIMFEVFRPAAKKVPNWSYSRLLALLTGDPDWSPSVDVPLFLEQEANAIYAESHYALSQLALIEGVGCYLQTEIYRGRQILLKIEPPLNLAGHEWESLLPVGAKFELRSPFFNRHRAINSAYCESDYWVAQIVHGLQQAPITAVLLHPIPPEELASFAHVQEDHCFLLANLMDTSAKRGLYALGQAGVQTEQSDVDMWKAKLKTEHIAASHLPLKQMLLKNEIAVDIDDPLQLIPIEPDFSESVANASQQKAIINALNHSVSLVLGPPGSGKSFAIAIMSEYLLTVGGINSLLIAAPTNGAADEITRKFMQRQRAIGTSIRFARVVSHSSAETKLQSGVQEDIHDAYLHNICHKTATTAGAVDPRSYSNYLNGMKQLIDTGFFESGTDLAHYEFERDDITAMILRQTQVVICTCSATALKQLRSNFKPEAIIIDEAAYAKHYEIILPLVHFSHTARRLVLVGDPRQFTGFRATREGEAQWSTSLFEKMYNANHNGHMWPSTMLLNIYRAHSRLCAHTSALFYQDRLLPARDANTPDAFMQKLQKYLPVNLKGSCGTTISISGYLHFVDVSDSTPDRRENGSSWNDPECSAAIAVADALIISGRVDPSKILILAGYTAAVNNLRTLGRVQGWDPASMKGAPQIMTANSAQGHEADIVILILVRAYDNLKGSMMTGAPLVNVATSRAKNLLIVIGHWPSVEHLKPCPLRKALIHMRDNNRNFVLPAVSSPLVLEPRLGQQVHRPGVSINQVTIAQRKINAPKAIAANQRFIEELCVEAQSIMADQIYDDYMFAIRPVRRFVRIDEYPWEDWRAACKKRGLRGLVLLCRLKMVLGHRVSQAIVLREKVHGIFRRVQYLRFENKEIMKNYM